MNTPPAPADKFSVTANEPIALDLACYSCEYNLRGLRPGGYCPECGRPIADSLAACDEKLGPAKWAHEFMPALDAISNSIVPLALAVVTAVFSLVMFVGLTLMGALLGVSALILAFFGGVPLLAGFIRITSRPRGATLIAAAERLRRNARKAMVGTGGSVPLFLACVGLYEPAAAVAALVGVACAAAWCHEHVRYIGALAGSWGWIRFRREAGITAVVVAFVCPAGFVGLASAILAAFWGGPPAALSPVLIDGLGFLRKLGALVFIPGSLILLVMLISLHVRFRQALKYIYSPPDSIASAICSSAPNGTVREDDHP